jgi:predicted NACHT family NTPase
MSDPIKYLCTVVLDIARTSPDANINNVMERVKSELDRNDELTNALQTDERILQINLGQSNGYQVLVKGNATAYIGGLDTDAFIRALGQLLDNIALSQRPVTPPNIPPCDMTPQEIDALVKQARKAIRRIIRVQCGTMRVLDMQHPIELTGENGIYTDVNILKGLTRNRSAEDVLQGSLNNQILDNPLGLSNEVERLPGLEVVRQYSRLLVLGKPGAGKTTFLKYLAMQCIAGKVKENKVPFFVNLRDFASENQQTNIVEYLAGSLPSDRIQLFEGRNPVEIVELLLQQGRCLILLDGLDEVRREDTSRINREIRNAADKFYESQFVITCRIAAKEYVFQQFTEVELADFDDRQVHTFARNWFQARFDSQGANSFEQRLQRFKQRLQSDKSIRELASNPLLLTLMCFVFSEHGEFPKRRADLYEEGVKILLKKWDASRNIQRDHFYQGLDVQRREDLLSFVAFQTFSQGELIVEQRKLVYYISDFLQNLINLDSGTLLAVSQEVLKSIEAQHGLLVERAMGVYSFSHLTLQEYFVAREISLTNQPTRQRELLQLLAENFSDSRWREVLLLMMEMLRNASSLLLEIKKEIDSQVAEDRELQSFLQWVCEKSCSVSTNYKIPGVRAFYYALTLSLDSEFAWEIDSTFDSNSTFDLMLDNLLNVTLNRAMADAVLPLHLDLNNALQFVDDNEDLKNKLCELYNRLPHENNTIDELKSWKVTDGQSWVKELRKCTIYYRNIGHNFDLSLEQRRLLRQYHDSSLFLWECLNTDCYVNRNIREYIQETLLLPVIEIERIKIERGLEF